MGAVSMHDDSERSARFVGQVLGRKSPVVDFRAAARLNASLPTPPGSVARPRAQLEAAAQGEDQRDPLESEVRLSLRPSRLPVVPNVQRHTRIDFGALTPARATWRFAQGAARLALAAAVGLALLTVVTIAARVTPTFFAAYLAETPTVKNLRAEMRVNSALAKDTLLPSVEEADEPAAASAASAATTLARKPAATHAKHRAPAKTQKHPAAHKHAAKAHSGAAKRGT